MGAQIQSALGVFISEHEQKLKRMTPLLKEKKVAQPRELADSEVALIQGEAKLLEKKKTAIN